MPKLPIDAHSLAVTLSPAFDRLLATHSAELVSGAGGALQRWLTAQLLLLIRRHEVLLLEMAIQLVAWEFEQFTVGEVVNVLVEIRSRSTQAGQVFKEQCRAGGGAGRGASGVERHA